MYEGTEDSNPPTSDNRIRRNVFEHNEPRETESGDNSGGDDREVGSKKRLGRTVSSNAGKPCILTTCFCICQHYHIKYRDEPANYTPPSQVTASHDRCPVKGHGLSD